MNLFQRSSVVSLVLFLLPTSGLFAEIQAPATDSGNKLMLREGTDVPLTFAEDLSSKTAAEGDSVNFLLGEDLKVGDKIVARAGSKANGEITNAKKVGDDGKSRRA